MDVLLFSQAEVLFGKKIKGLIPLVWADHCIYMNCILILLLLLIIIIILTV